MSNRSKRQVITTRKMRNALKAGVYLSKLYGERCGELCGRQGRASLRRRKRIAAWIRAGYL